MKLTYKNETTQSTQPFDGAQRAEVFNREGEVVLTRPLTSKAALEVLRRV